MHNNREADMLVSTEWLAAHLGDPDICVVDTRKGDGYDIPHMAGAVRYPTPITPFLKERGRVPKAERSWMRNWRKP
jgi:3-mercaptopyruvate sulfurtransferase SseA